MSNAIANTVRTPVAAPSQPPAAVRKTADRQTADQKTAAAKPPAAAGVAVTLSTAALSAAKEAAETPAQTAQEARGNDVQAQRLLAKEKATRQAYR